MPHNRQQKEDEVRQEYSFVVTGGEYSALQGAIAAADIYFTGGQITLAVLQSDLQDLGQKAITEMAAAGVNPLTEPVYAGYFTFNNWETPLPGVKIDLPNKFVPYVAARKKSPPGPIAPTDVIKNFQVAPDLPVLLRLADGTIYLFDGVEKWHVPDPDALTMVYKQFSLRPVFDENDYPSHAGQTPAQLRAAFETFVKSIPG